MNKKFSTLLASFLLAGGLFSTADAIDLVKAAKDTYYDLHKTAEFKNSHWKNADNSVLCKGVTIEVCEDGKSVRFLKDGEVLTYVHEKGTFSEFDVKYAKANTLAFTTGSDNLKKDANKITFTVEGKDYVLTSISEDGELTFAKSGSGASYIAINAEIVNDQVLTAGDLNYYEEDGFSVTITGDADQKIALANNPFTGHLTPMTWNAAEKKFVAAVSSADKFYLKNAAGKYIVAVKYDGEGGNKNESIYGFTTVAENTLKNDLVRAADASLKDGQEYFGEFQAKADRVAYDADKKALTALTNLYVNVADVNTKNATWYELGRYDFSSVPTLVASVNKTNNGTELKEIYIKLGSGQVVDPADLLVKGKFYTVKRIKDKKTLLLVANDYYSNSEPWVESYDNVLEGQWALTVDEENGKYVFANRETPEITWSEIATSSLYTTNTENTYTVGATTYVITPVAEHAATDGYVTLDVTKTAKFNIAYASSVYGNAWFTENHEGATDHTIGLDTDIDNALVFTATEHAEAAYSDDKNGDYIKEYYPTDSIYVISKLGYYDEDGVQQSTLDTLKVVTYSFVNQYGEGLSSTVDYNGDLYEGSKLSSIKGSTGSRFALRQDGEKLNLRATYIERFVQLENVFDENYNYQVFGSVKTKVYAGDASNGILSWTYLYQRTENDLFVIEATDVPQYRRLVNEIDTVSIYRDENSSQLLYEEGALLTTENEAGETEVLAGFLGLQNANQFEIAPAMLADTAYVRNETYKPLYMLAVGTTIVPAGKYCPVHGADADCKDEHLDDVAGWVEGRYLVCLEDSAKAWDEGKHKNVTNPYKYEGMNKLGFVQAVHRNDSLIIASNNKQYYLGAGAMNPATFAFRYVDVETGSFVVETHCGYIKWINGNVVVTDKINDADVFNMNEEETSAPTANETIAASAVTVVAGEGNVTIAGAAGKKVVIANILGQTIANTVLTSDNATIAAPAGVVVVAVEGEAAVKAIVK